MRELLPKLNEWFDKENVPKKDRTLVIGALGQLPGNKAKVLVEDAFELEWPLEFMMMELNIGGRKDPKPAETSAPVPVKGDDRQQEEADSSEDDPNEPEFQVIEEPSGGEGDIPESHKAVEKPNKKGFKIPTFGLGKLKGLLMKPSNKPGKEVAAKKPGKSGPGILSKLPSNKTMLVGTGVGLVFLVLLLVWFWNFGMGMRDNGSSSDNYDFGNVIIDPVNTVEPSTDPQNQPSRTLSGANPDQEFWFGLKAVEVPELSPGNMGGQQNEDTVIGIFLMLVLTVFAYFEGKSRKKGQQSAIFFSMAGVLSGWFAMPLLIFMSTATVGMFWLSTIIFVALWATAASTIKSQSDLSPFTVALAVFTASLFYAGSLTVIPVIGALFGFTWPTLAGVTTVGGALTLLVTGRAEQAFLTIIIFTLGFTVMYLASREVGKKHGRWAPLLIGFVIILGFSLLSWGLNSGVLWLVANYEIPLMVEVLFRILAPFLAWLMSLLGAILIGAGLGDVEVGMKENRQKLGLEKTGTFIENMSDFMILGTIIPLFLGVIIKFF